MQMARPRRVASRTAWRAGVETVFAVHESRCVAALGSTGEEHGINQS